MPPHPHPPPLWARTLLRWLAPRGQADDVLGDLQESQGRSFERHGPLVARARTAIETLDMAAALLRTRLDLFGIYRGAGTMQDYKLGVRMLVKYPGLSIAGGLALAIAIGIGAGWYDVMNDVVRPRLPFPDGDRYVEVHMRNAATGAREFRVLHDFAAWRQSARSITDLGAYRTLERNLISGDATPEQVMGAEITTSAFDLVAVPPLLGRPLLDADAQPGAPPVVVLGYDLWQRRFGGRTDIVGLPLRLGRDTLTVVGVMPKGFGFPVKHQLWVPLRLSHEGYGPLEGPAVQLFGRLAPGATLTQAQTELTALTERAAAASPQTHEHLRPSLHIYAAEYAGEPSWVDLAFTHLPIVLVLIVACMNVGTLVYARTATREAEIAMRHALGASRGRIITQLFVEALVLASVAAAVGLTAAHLLLTWVGTTLLDGGVPFWMTPGLNFSTVLFGAGLTLAAAASFGILPALKATGAGAQAQLKNLGAGGSTLKFGKVWTTAMVGQVALTAVCMAPAMDLARETWRDRIVRARYPAAPYLGLRIEVDRNASLVSGGSGDETRAAFAARVDRTYSELARRIAQEPGVVAVTFADQLPGTSPDVRSAEIEVAPGAEPRRVPNLWTAAVGPGYFETFDVPVLAGRDFHNGDRAPDARTVLVNEAVARRYFGGANPVGHRVRFAESARPEPWFEIVGMVRDIGVTPTNLGEAPYVYRAAVPGTVSPLLVGVRVGGDPAVLGPRLLAIAADLDAGVRLRDIRSLEDLIWNEERANVMMAGGTTGVVVLGLFLSAAAIYSLMSVSVARRTREIGVRMALGATPTRLLGGIFSRAFLIVGGGLIAGPAVILPIAMRVEVPLGRLFATLALTALVMLTMGLLACIGPARRALRIHPTDALRGV